MKSKRNKISIMARKKKVKEEIKRIIIIWSRIDEKAKHTLMMMLRDTSMRFISK